VRLAVGDIVVYGRHGAGAIAAREHKLIRGTPHEVIVLALTGGLRVELPLEQAQQRLRPLATESELTQVKKALSTPQPGTDETWLKRQKTALAKLSAGDPIALAEIIRDSARREHRLRSTKTAHPTLSPRERELLTHARRLLATEIALLRGIQPEEADAWIDQQLQRAA
jgi:RNA polymerase-interacting CarD/CdnL/TRCF family regulator